MIISILGCLLGHYTTEPLDWTRNNEEQMAERICFENNRARESKGLSRLRRNPALNRAAQLHAERMRDHQFIAHKDPIDARFLTPADRVVASGGNGDSVSENLAQLPSIKLPNREMNIYVIDKKKHHYSLTPNGTVIQRHSTASFATYAVNEWLKSPGHRANLLNKDNETIGCGAVYVFSNQGPPMINAVTVFGGTPLTP